MAAGNRAVRHIQFRLTQFPLCPDKASFYPVELCNDDCYLVFRGLDTSLIPGHRRDGLPRLGCLTLALLDRASTSCGHQGKKACSG